MKNMRNNQKNVDKNVKVVIVLTIFHNKCKFGMSYNSCRLLLYKVLFVSPARPSKPNYRNVCNYLLAICILFV